MQNSVVFNGNASLELLELDSFYYAITVYRLWKSMNQLVTYTGISTLST